MCAKVFLPEILSFLYSIFNIVGMTEVVEGETSDEKEIDFKSSSGSLSRMSFASSPHVVEVYIGIQSWQLEKIYPATS